MVYITQTEVNAVFDEQVRRCADILQKKTKEYTRCDTLKGVYTEKAIRE
ncbi:MAG: hypothetical protein Q4C91_10015 [Eubacteriales bacterium]|nr:hypothetical protein [Eubacteriales bacterium]